MSTCVTFAARGSPAPSPVTSSGVETPANRHLARRHRACSEPRAAADVFRDHDLAAQLLRLVLQPRGDVDGIAERGEDHVVLVTDVADDPLPAIYADTETYRLPQVVFEFTIQRSMLTAIHRSSCMPGGLPARCRQSSPNSASTPSPRNWLGAPPGATTALRNRRFEPIDEEHRVVRQPSLRNAGRPAHIDEHAHDVPLLAACWRPDRHIVAGAQSAGNRGRTRRPYVGAELAREADGGIRARADAFEHGGLGRDGAGTRRIADATNATGGAACRAATDGGVRDLLGEAPRARSWPLGTRTTSPSGEVRLRYRRAARVAPHAARREDQR